MKDLYIKHYWAPQYQVITMDNVYDIVSTLSFLSTVAFTLPKPWMVVVQPMNIQASQQSPKPQLKPPVCHITLWLVKHIACKRSRAIIPVQSWTTISVIHLNSMGLICSTFGW